MIIGLTGNIATGKSTISNMLETKYNIPVIDADKIAREVVEPGEETLSIIAETFGRQVLLIDGTLNRKKLGEIIFQDASKRETLNNIVHPAVREKMDMKKKQLLQKGFTTIVLDIPLLFENDLTYLADKTMVVYTQEDIQLQRLMERNQLTETDAKNRMNAQMALKKKCELADAVIDNSGTIEYTAEQLEEILNEWGLNNQ